MTRITSNPPVTPGLDTPKPAADFNLNVQWSDPGGQTAKVEGNSITIAGVGSNRGFAPAIASLLLAKHVPVSTSILGQASPKQTAEKLRDGLPPTFRGTVEGGENNSPAKLTLTPTEVKIPEGLVGVRHGSSWVYVQNQSPKDGQEFLNRLVQQHELSVPGELGGDWKITTTSGGFDQLVRSHVRLTGG